MADGERWVESFGSPLYIYDLARVDEAGRNLRSDLPAGAVVYYSLKANPHPLVVHRLQQAGCLAEVSSGGELAAAGEAGFRGDQILFTGPGKTAAELDQALAQGVRRFSVESVGDHGRVAEAAARTGVVAECLVRVNAGSARGGSGLRMSGSASPFGVDLDQLLAGRSRFDSPSTRLIGAHFYPLSNARDEKSLLVEMQASIEAAAALRDEAGLPMRVVDLGGGFAAPYARPGVRPRYRRLRAALEPVLDDRLPGWRDGAVEVGFESGRYLSGDCGELVSTVLDVKESAGQSFVVLDAGINHLGGMSGLGRMLPAGALAGRTGEESQGAIVGPLCTPADVLSRCTGVGGIVPGDVVRIPNVGAYGLTASLVAFLSRATPTEVVVDGDRLVGATRLAVGRTMIEGAL